MDGRLTLSLPEAVLLLAIDERSGAVRGAGELRYGLAGAMLIELSLHGRLVCEGRRLIVVDRRLPSGVERLPKAKRASRVTRVTYDSLGVCR